MCKSEDRPHQVTVHGDPVKHSAATIQGNRAQSEWKCRKALRRLLRARFLDDQQLTQLVSLVFGEADRAFGFELLQA